MNIQVKVHELPKIIEYNTYFSNEQTQKDKKDGIGKLLKTLSGLYQTFLINMQVLKWSFTYKQHAREPPKIIAENLICDPFRPKFSILIPVLPKKCQKKWK